MLFKHSPNVHKSILEVWAVVRPEGRVCPASTSNKPVMRSSGGRIGTEAVLVVAVPHLLVGGGYPGGIHWRRLRDRRSVGFVQIHVMSDWMLNQYRTDVVDYFSHSLGVPLNADDPF